MLHFLLPLTLSDKNAENVITMSILLHPSYTNTQIRVVFRIHLLVDTTKKIACNQTEQKGNRIR